MVIMCIMKVIDCSNKNSHTHIIGSHFEKEREKHGEEYTLDFGEVDPFLSEIIYSEDERKLFVFLSQTRAIH